MNADLFMTCFLACTFSFVVFGVIGWQVSRFLIRRSLTKNMPKIIHDAVHGTTPAHVGFSDEMFSEALEYVAQLTDDQLERLLDRADREGSRRQQGQTS